jgi:hypothetical protein
LSTGLHLNQNALALASLNVSSSSRPQLLRKTFKQAEQPPANKMNAAVSDDDKISLDSLKASDEHMSLLMSANCFPRKDEFERHDSNISLKSMDQFDELNKNEKLE